MPKYIQAGQRFGRLIAQSRKIHILPSGGRKARWLCICDCGNSKTVLATHLSAGKTQSCGCIVKEGAMSRTHGMSQHPMNKRYRNMKKRCYSETDARYHRYGGRGIVMCDAWRDDFMAFYKHFGDLTSDQVIDRIDNDGPYSPENCQVLSRSGNSQKQWVEDRFRPNYKG